jgi:hypothetical protein
MITIENPSQDLEQYLDETKSVLNNKYFESHNLEELLSKGQNINGIYENKIIKEGITNVDYYMTINPKDVIRKYKIPKFVKKYFLTFRPKNNSVNKEEYYNKIRQESKNIEYNKILYMQEELEVPNLETQKLVGKILSLTNKDLYCNGYITYDRPVMKDKKLVKIKRKYAIIYNSTIYEYSKLESIKFMIK